MKQILKHMRGDGVLLVVYADEPDAAYHPHDEDAELSGRVVAGYDHRCNNNDESSTIVGCGVIARRLWVDVGDTTHACDFCTECGAMSPHLVHWPVEHPEPVVVVTPEPAPIPHQHDDGIHAVGDSRATYGIQALGAFHVDRDDRPTAIYGKGKQLDATVPQNHVLIPVHIARLSWRRPKP